MTTATRALAIEAALVAVLATAGIAARASIVATGWVYVGGDSYGYVAIADEWRAHGRLAFRPEPLPLEWYRRPLYPLFVAAVKGAAPAKRSGGSGWRRIQLGQLALELLIAWPLLYAAVRRRAGPMAALIALALAALFPPALLFPLAALTESLAMTLAIVAVLPLLFFEREDSPRAWGLAAVGAALSSLLRPDGVLCTVAVAPLVPGRRRGVALYALVFALLFLPWPIRNLVHCGRAHLADGMIDRFGADVPAYRGYWDWMRSWSKDGRAAAFPASCFYDALCDTTADLYEELGAFEAPATNVDLERDRVAKLLERRKHLGVSWATSDAFEALAQARRRVHPFRVLVRLPLERAWRAWWEPPDELGHNEEKWPRLVAGTLPHFAAFAHALVIATLAAILVLALTPGYRRTCLVLALPLVTRTLMLGWTGFSLPRYVAPGYPLCFALIGIGAAALAQRLRPRV